MKFTRRPSVSLVSLKWWSTLKSAEFGSSSSLPLPVGGGGGQVYQSVGQANLLRLF